jgi:hypothetical protein
MFTYIKCFLVIFMIVGCLQFQINEEKLSSWFRCISLFVQNTTTCISLIWDTFNRIRGVMISVLASSVVDRGFEPRSGQAKDYKIGNCCFFVKHATVRRKSKDWLVRNQDNVSDWGDTSIRELLLQWASTIKKIKLSVLV